jgi:DNA-binding winged helix-turn-helix (wHTH) protein
LLYSFEDFTLDTDRRELRQGETALPVEPQIFDLLAYLIGNRERVVGRDDLREAIWNGRIVSEATLGSRINAVRSVLGDNGEEQRLIRTLPRKGFRFVGEVHEVAPAGETTATVAPPRMPPRVGKRRTWILVAGGAVAAIAAVSAIWFAWRASPSSAPARKFDAAAIPLVSDATRRMLADYASWPDAKALAISGYSFGTAYGAPDVEAAKAEALERCRAAKSTSACRLYAVAMNVVWTTSVLPLPLPADVRAEPLAAPVTATWLRRSYSDDYIGQVYKSQSNHKALAISGFSGQLFWSVHRESQAEAARTALEICSYERQAPCFVFSVDGFMTVEIPRSRPIVEFFLIGSDFAIPPEARAGIARVYQGKDWRALARGGKGGWYPVAGAPSEAAAVEAALKLCNAADPDCRIWAIGSFRVAQGG